MTKGADMTATAKRNDELLNRPLHPVEALFDAADRFPDGGEGSRWHLCNTAAHTYRYDLEQCRERGDRAGERDCTLDALDMLACWTREAEASQ